MRIVKQQLSHFGKNIIRIIFGSVIVLSLSVSGETRPPSAIELTYDQSKKSLHIVVKHVSENMRKHYIRKIEITRNKEKPVPYFYSSQTSAAEMIVDIPLTAMPNDSIRVEAVCSEAVRTEQTLAIPEE